MQNAVTVGRILHVILDDDGRCLPAIVVFAHDNLGSINVQVFEGDKTTHIELIHPNHDRKIKNTWHWPRECREIKGA